MVTYCTVAEYNQTTDESGTHFMDIKNSLNLQTRSKIFYPLIPLYDVIFKFLHK